MGAQQLHRHQPDQAQTGHDNGFAECWLREANALQRDRSEHGESGGLVGHRIGHLRAQIHRHRHQFGVLAVAGDPVADRVAAHAGADFHHLANVAVAHGKRLVELVAHRGDRRHQPVGADLVEHHAHLVGLLARLVDQAGLAEVDHHAFGAGRDQRARGAHQQLPAASAGAGNVGDFRGAVLQVLQDLFHTDVTGRNGKLSRRMVWMRSTRNGSATRSASPMRRSSTRKLACADHSTHSTCERERTPAPQVLALNTVSGPRRNFRNTRPRLASWRGFAGAGRYRVRSCRSLSSICPFLAERKRCSAGDRTWVSSSLRRICFTRSDLRLLRPSVRRAGQCRWPF